MSTGYEITLSNLKWLLRYDMTESEIQAYITQPLSLRIVNGEEGLEFYDSGGRPVSIRKIHDQIQADSGLQFDIYQFAMSKWM
jgi:hypothetical protein